MTELPAWREGLRRRGLRLVATNGCFDLLHRGHVASLEAARALGDSLLVGLNSDESVAALKGPGRPWTSEADRVCILTALRAVDAVCVFPETTAVRFLEQARPDIYVKGGDYTLETMNQEERRMVESQGGRVVLVAELAGRSTSALLKRIA
ncbi:MAG: adenylyltransferase/cytidyltransferase family protein [Verrucomicrobiales bacterium]|nr:adenylyltransferase/cytidyltransferase family protein [Verrucomicrobiales bacterium]